jgi:hypothetical protein
MVEKERVRAQPGTLMKASGQALMVRLTLLWVPLIALVTVLLAAFDALGRSDAQRGLLIILGLVVGILSYTWAVYTVRCPNCRTKLVWRALQKGASDWYEWLLALEACPGCGAKGSVENSAPRAGDV